MPVLVDELVLVTRVLNERISTKTFFIGSRISMADIDLFVAYSGLANKTGSKIWSEYGHFCRWFNTIRVQVMKAFEPTKTPEQLVANPSKSSGARLESEATFGQCVFIFQYLKLIKILKFSFLDWSIIKNGQWPIYHQTKNII